MNKHWVILLTAALTLFADRPARGDGTATPETPEAVCQALLNVSAPKYEAAISKERHDFGGAAHALRMAAHLMTDLQRATIKAYLGGTGTFGNVAQVLSGGAPSEALGAIGVSVSAPGAYTLQMDENPKHDIRYEPKFAVFKDRAKPGMPPTRRVYLMIGSPAQQPSPEQIQTVMVSVTGDLAADNAAITHSLAMAEQTDAVLSIDSVQGGGTSAGLFGEMARRYGLTEASFLVAHERIPEDCVSRFASQSVAEQLLKEDGFVSAYGAEAVSHDELPSLSAK